MIVVKDPSFASLPPDITRLFELAAKESLFSSPAWYDLMSRFGVEGCPQIRLYIDGESDCQLGFVTQAVQGTKLNSTHVLRSLTSAYSCEHRIILAPTADRKLVLQKLARFLATESPAWDRVILGGLDPTDEVVSIFAAALREVGFAVQPFFDSATWYEGTAGLSFPDYLAARPAVLRNTWRRKLAKLERFSPPGFSYYDSIEGLERGIAEYQEIYRNSWKPDERFPHFMPELMRMAGRKGALRLGTMHIGGRPVAAQFWLVWQSTACIYKLAHDASLDEYSPGTILTMRMMELILSRDKPIEVNFGRGDDPYKKLWLPRRRERWGLAAANPRTLRGLSHVLLQTAARLARPLRSGKPPPPID